MLLLIVIDPTGHVSYVPLDRTVTLGGRGPDHVSIAGLDGPALVVEVSEHGPRIVPRGPTTILVNGEPPTHGRTLRAGDTFTFAGVEARITRPAEIRLDTREVGATAVLRQGGADEVASSGPLTMIGRLRQLFLLADATEPPLTILLELALEATEGFRATLVAHTPDGGLVPRLSTGAGPRANPLIAPAGLLNEARHDGHAILARPEGAKGSLLVAPVLGSDDVPLVLVVESDREPDDAGAARLEALSVISEIGGLALDHRRRVRTRAMNERMTTIGQVMAGVAHDIKNLLTGLKTGIYFLDETLGEHGEARIRDAWDLLKGAQRSIQSLVGDMLAYSKPEVPEIRPTSLPQVIERALENLRARVEAKEVDLVIDLESLPPMPLDGAAMERCVLNLVGNAVDAVAGRTGRVEVRLAREGPEAVLTIVDNGPGVPRAARERVFDLLYSTKGVRGTGFGLAITRKIIQEHGGKIALGDGAEGGAAFTVKLPLE